MGNRTMTGSAVALCVAAVCTAAGVRAAVPGESLMEVLAERLGKAQAAVAAECASGLSDSDVLVPANCFDGIRMKAQAVARFPQSPVNCSWLATMSQNPYVQLAIPDEARVSAVVRGYRLTRMTTGFYSHDRAPTGWRIEGSIDTRTWELIDERSGITWEGSQADDSHRDGNVYDPAQADCEKEFACAAAKPYKYLRFTPTASPHTDKVATGNVGLFEIEYFAVVSPQRGLLVRHGIDAVEKDGFSLADGGLQTEGGTVSAPEIVTVTAGVERRYTCAGNVVETLENDGGFSVTTNRGATYVFSPDDQGHRLTWLWRLRETAQVVNYRDLILSVNGTYSTEGGVENVDFAAGSGAGLCFDGISVSVDSSLRYVGKVGSHASLLVGGAQLEDMMIRPVRYRLWQHSTGYYCNERAPTGWKLEGLRTSDGGWDTLDEVSGCTWYAQTNSALYGSGESAVSPWKKNAADLRLNCIERELDIADSYYSYRLTMTAAGCMEGLGQQWDAGLMEIELDVKGEFSETATGHLTVANNLDVVGCAPVPGVYQLSKGVSSIVCTAPERVFQDGRLYFCRGYSIEADSGEGWSAPVTNLGARTYCYDTGMNEIRLTWIWEHVASRLSILNESGGETIVIEAEHYENPDVPGERYYAVGRPVEVVFDTSSAPTPSRFTGEIAGDTDGVKVAEDRLTVLPDRPRRITAYFERRWKYLSAEENGGESAVTDGNWVLAASPARAADIVNASGTVYARGGEYLIFAMGAYRAGSGRLDLSLLNADLAVQRESEPGALPLLWLGDGSFAAVSQITELVVPADIVGGFAAPFKNCPNLVSVKYAPTSECWAFSDREGPFADCRALARVSLPNVRRIPRMAFSGCTALRSVELSSRLEQIDYKAFFNCRELAGSGRIVLPKSLAAIEESAFEKATLDVLDLSKTSLREICNATFVDCSFKRIILPRCLKKIGKAFNYREESYRPTSMAIVELTGASLPEQEENMVFANEEYLPTNYGASFLVAVCVPGEHLDNYTSMVYKEGAPAPRNQPFLPKESFSDSLKERPNYDEAVRYGRRFVGRWYTTWLLTAPKKGFVLIVE